MKALVFLPFCLAIIGCTHDPAVVTELRSLNATTTALKADVAQLRTDVATLNTNVSTLNTTANTISTTVQQTSPRKRTPVFLTQFCRTDGNNNNCVQSIERDKADGYCKRIGYARAVGVRAGDIYPSLVWEEVYCVD